MARLCAQVRWTSPSRRPWTRLCGTDSLSSSGCWAPRQVGGAHCMAAPSRPCCACRLHLASGWPIITRRWQRLNDKPPPPPLHSRPASTCVAPPRLCCLHSACKIGTAAPPGWLQTTGVSHASTWVETGVSLRPPHSSHEPSYTGSCTQQRKAGATCRILRACASAACWPTTWRLVARAPNATHQVLPAGGLVGGQRQDARREPAAARGHHRPGQVDARCAEGGRQLGGALEPPARLQHRGEGHVLCACMHGAQAQGAREA